MELTDLVASRKKQKTSHGCKDIWGTFCRCFSFRKDKDPFRDEREKHTRFHCHFEKKKKTKATCVVLVKDTPCVVGKGQTLCVFERYCAGTKLAFLWFVCLLICYSCFCRKCVLLLLLLLYIYSWIFFLVTIAGFVMSVLAAASCRFVEYVDSNGVPQAAGFFRFHDPSLQQCVRYGEESSIVELWDESERAARTAARLAPLLALGSLVLVVVEFCCCRIVCSRIIEGTALLAAVVLQGITFLFIDSTTFWYDPTLLLLLLVAFGHSPRLFLLVWSLLPSFCVYIYIAVAVIC